MGLGDRDLSLLRVDLVLNLLRGAPFMDAKQTVEAFVHAINSQDWASLDSLVAVDFVRHSIAAGDPHVRSRSDLVMYLRGEFEIFPDAQEIILDIFAEGEKVAVRHGFNGTQRGPMGSYPPTGKTMHAEYIAIYRVRNGLLIEAWVEWDNLAGLRQLGHL
jgi:predicted ester cyclase